MSKHFSITSISSFIPDSIYFLMHSVCEGWRQSWKYILRLTIFVFFFLSRNNLYIARYHFIRFLVYNNNKQLNTNYWHFIFEMLFGYLQNYFKIETFYNSLDILSTITQMAIFFTFLEYLNWWILFRKL